MLSSQLENEMKNYAKEKKNFDVELKSVCFALCTNLMLIVATDIKSVFPFQARKKYEEVVCEKDAAVVRYAKNESELINIRKEKENLLKRVKNVEHERDDLVKKMKNLNCEKILVSQTLDTKVSS